MYKNTIIGFHKPEEPNGYLSNWYKSNFILDGVAYSSMEQYMMRIKALTFGCEDIAEQILETDNVAKIKDLGRKVRNYNDTVWSGIRQIVVYNGLLAKFSQSKELKNKLLSTGDAILAECAVSDKIWGIGIALHDAKRNDMRNWKGTNLLGFTLMQVREALR